MLGLLCRLPVSMLGYIFRFDFAGRLILSHGGTETQFGGIYFRERIRAMYTVIRESEHDHFL